MSAGGSGFRAASSWSPSGGPEAPRPFPSTGTLQMVRCIVREEGVAGLYRGFGISVASTVPTSAVWWGSYGEEGGLNGPAGEVWGWIAEEGRKRDAAHGEVLGWTKCILLGLILGNAQMQAI